MLSLLHPKFKAKLEPFAKTILKARMAMGDQFIDSGQFDALPFADGLPNPELWKLRQKDLAFITNLIGNQKALRILEIGAHNGWLSNRLAGMSHKVLAVDYFNDTHDGLGSIVHYSKHNWTPIQMNLNELSPLRDEKFDLIIVNRCAVFFENPAATFQLLKELLFRPGRLVITGMQFFKKEEEEKARVEKLQQDFEQAHGAPLFLAPIKGFFNLADYEVLKNSGFKFHPVSSGWKHWAKRHLVPGGSFNCQAIYDHG